MKPDLKIMSNKKESRIKKMNTDPKELFRRKGLAEYGYNVIEPVFTPSKRKPEIGKRQQYTVWLSHPSLPDRLIEVGFSEARTVITEEGLIKLDRFTSDKRSEHYQERKQEQENFINTLFELLNRDKTQIVCSTGSYRFACERGCFFINKDKETKEIWVNFTIPVSYKDNKTYQFKNPSDSDYDAFEQAFPFYKKHKKELGELANV